MFGQFTEKQTPVFGHGGDTVDEGQSYLLLLEWRWRGW